MQKAAQPCHTCRRRRVKCDRSLPSCKKCHDSHHECLGYQKLFLWNRGVASRGKMMGKTFPTASAPTPTPTPMTEHEPDMPANRNIQSLGRQSTVAEAANPTIKLDSVRDARFMALGTRLVYGSLHARLNDPHFRGLGTMQRFYMHCFGTNISKSLVLYDVPGENPFQSLVQYAEHHELLRQIIVATAALYACRMYHLTDVESLDLSKRLNSGLEPRRHTRSCRAMWHTLQDAYQDSVKAKLSALGLLAKAIQTGDVRSDIVCTCVLLFVHFELMRPESVESRIHLKGALALFKGLRPSKRAVQTVRNTVISDSILFDTMELALDHTRPWSSSIGNSLLPLFESISTSNHTTYPPELLRSFTVACEYVRKPPSVATPDSETGVEIRNAIKRVAAIDARGWSESFYHIHSCTTCPDDLEVRIHLCEAHKAASIIFLARAAGLTPATPIETYQNRLVEHLGHILHGQYLFKATSWPTFIAGLEASNEKVASGLVDRLQLMCSILPYDFAHRALCVLKRVRLEAQPNPDICCEPRTGWVARLSSILTTM